MKAWSVRIYVYIRKDRRNFYDFSRRVYKENDDIATYFNKMYVEITDFRYYISFFSNATASSIHM